MNTLIKDEGWVQPVTRIVKLLEIESQLIDDIMKDLDKLTKILEGRE